MGELLKIVRNKKNNQLFVSLPRKRLNIDKNCIPDYLEMQKMKLIFLKKKKEATNE